MHFIRQTLSYNYYNIIWDWGFTEKLKNPRDRSLNCGKIVQSRKQNKKIKLRSVWSNKNSKDQICEKKNFLSTNGKYIHSSTAFDNSYLLIIYIFWNCKLALTYKKARAIFAMQSPMSTEYHGILYIFFYISGSIYFLAGPLLQYLTNKRGDCQVYRISFLY